jgi:hypothetical protein
MSILDKEENIMKSVIAGLFFLLLFGCTAQQDVPLRDVCVIGEVISISPVWTKNGDGELMINHADMQVLVSIVGFPSACRYPTTEIHLKTGENIQDLLHKEIVVCGVFDKKYHMIAKEISEVEK